MPKPLVRSLIARVTGQRVQTSLYREALDRCAEVAFEEYENASSLLRDTELLFRRLEHGLSGVAATAGRATVTTKLAAEQLDDFARQLKRVIVQDAQVPAQDNVSRSGRRATVRANGFVSPVARASTSAP